MAAATANSSNAALSGASVSESGRVTWDHLYHVPAEDLQKIRDSKPWAADSGKAHPKYFTKVMCSASATVKMVSAVFYLFLCPDCRRPLTDFTLSTDLSLIVLCLRGSSS